MSTEIQIDGPSSVGDIKSGWSVTEDATPVAPGDTSGGVGSVSASAKYDIDSEFIIDRPASLVHSELGTVAGGTVVNVSIPGQTDATLTDAEGINISTLLASLNVDRTIPPHGIAGGYGTPFFDQQQAPGATSAYPFRAASTGGIAVDKNRGYLYASTWGGYPFDSTLDLDSYGIVMHRTDGEVLLMFAATVGSGNGQFGQVTAGPPATYLGGPTSMAHDDVLNHLYVYDEAHRRVQCFDTAVSTLLSTGPSFLWTTSGNFNTGSNPKNAITVHPQTHEIYVTDKASATGVFRRFQSDGTYVGTTVGFGSNVSYGNPQHLAIDEEGNFYVAHVRSSSTVGPTGITKWGPSFNSGDFIGNFPMIPDARLGNSASYFGYARIKFSPSGKLWVSVIGRNFLVQVNRDTGAEEDRLYIPGPTLGPTDFYDFDFGADGTIYPLLIVTANDSSSAGYLATLSGLITPSEFHPEPIRTSIEKAVSLVDESIPVIWNSSVGSEFINVPAYRGSVWEYMKQIASGIGVQISARNSRSPSIEEGGSLYSSAPVYRSVYWPGIGFGGLRVAMIQETFSDPIYGDSFGTYVFLDGDPSPIRIPVPLYQIPVLIPADFVTNIGGIDRQIIAIVGGFSPVPAAPPHPVYLVSVNATNNNIQMIKASSEYAAGMAYDEVAGIAVLVNGPTLLTATSDTWTSQTAPFTNAVDVASDGNGTFVISNFGMNGYYSNDGINWSSDITIPNDYLNVVRAGGLFYFWDAVSPVTQFQTWDSGIANQPSDFPGEIVSRGIVAFDGYVYVLVSGENGNEIWVSEEPPAGGQFEWMGPFRYSEEIYSISGNGDNGVAVFTERGFRVITGFSEQNNIVVEDLGTRTLRTDNVQSGSVRLQINSQATGRRVEFKNYNSSSGSGTVYDSFVANTVHSVNAGQTSVVSVATNNFPISINQPYIVDITAEPADTVFQAVPPGAYAVSDANGIPLEPAEWESYGGSVSVAINPDTPGTIDVTFVGPSEIPGAPGPYSFSVSDGSNQYPLFSVTGYGVFTNPETVSVWSGANWGNTTQEVAFSVDNITHSSKARIYERVTWSLARASGPIISLTLTVPTSSIEGFGLTPGSIISHRNQEFRVDSAGIGNEWTSISASRFVTAGEWDEWAGGKTVGDFDSAWNGYRAEDFKIKSYREIG